VPQNAREAQLQVMADVRRVIDYVAGMEF